MREKSTPTFSINPSLRSIPFRSEHLNRRFHRRRHHRQPWPDYRISLYYLHRRHSTGDKHWRKSSTNFKTSVTPNPTSKHQTDESSVFTRSWLQIDENQPIKAIVFMNHDYRNDLSWCFQKICIEFANWGNDIIVGRKSRWHLS
ncbi:hypothetical protein SSX86_023736 [Deinandra increscens subsp. villosa]|uniref:Uncharacterized protein n=1 Tax=Deinandra increscens subsp. villosa TaxID=3103831 RepID=A0AAP0CRF8_9ASTR